MSLFSTRARRTADVVSETWARITLSTDRTDTSWARGSIERVYRLAGLQPPGRFLWVPSPREVPSAQRIHPTLTAHPVANELALQRGRLCRVLDRAAIALGGRGLAMRERLRMSIAEALQLSLAVAFAETTGKHDGISWFWGQHEGAWLAFAAWLRAYQPTRLSPAHIEGLDAWMAVARQCGWWWPYRDVCIVADRPISVHVDSRRAEPQLHCADGPAVLFRDGWRIYAIDGVELPGRVVELPSTITVDDIRSERNAERRRILMDLYGVERFLDKSGALRIHADQYGVLYRCAVEDGEDVVMVMVRNSTPEPDGSYKNYVLRVAPWITTAHEAVAWTFGLTADDYRPLVET